MTEKQKITFELWKFFLELHSGIIFYVASICLASTWPIYITEKMIFFVVCIYLRNIYQYSIWMGLPPTKRSAYFHSFHLFCKFYLQSTKDLDVTLSIRVGKMILLVSTPSNTEIPLPTPDKLLNLIRCWCLLQYLLQKGFMDVSCSCRINGVCQCLSGKKMS